MRELDIIREVAPRFELEGELMEAAPLGEGHINDTILATFATASGPRHVVFQRINTGVFQRPRELMSNMRRVTERLRVKAQDRAGSDRAESAIRLVSTRQSDDCHEDAQGHFWRAYFHIDAAPIRDHARTPGESFQAGRAYGRFLRDLTDLPGPRLHETIPDFHHGPRRVRSFRDALRDDPAGRAAGAAPEIEAAERHAPVAAILQGLKDSGRLPERITHNDAKFSNVLLDAGTGEAICVIDLDTVMPGLAPYDFGDLVRTGICAAAEDERDLTKIDLSLEQFEAIARGYLLEAGSILTETEIANLVTGGKLLTYLIGLRFLTDYLLGDRYFKTAYPEHSLDRCRTQFRLLDLLCERELLLDRAIERVRHQPGE